MQRHSLQEGHGFFPSRVAVSQCGASLRGVDWWSVEMGRSETSFIRDWDERRVFLTVLLTEKIRAQPSCCLQLLTSDLSLVKTSNGCLQAGSHSPWRKLLEPGESLLRLVRRGPKRDRGSGGKERRSGFKRFV